MRVHLLPSLSRIMALRRSMGFAQAGQAIASMIWENHTCTRAPHSQVKLWQTVGISCVGFLSVTSAISTYSDHAGAIAQHSSSFPAHSLPGSAARGCCKSSRSSRVSSDAQIGYRRG